MSIYPLDVHIIAGWWFGTAVVAQTFQVVRPILAELGLVLAYPYSSHGQGVSHEIRYDCQW